MNSNFPTFNALVLNKILLKSVAKMIAASGLNLQQISLICARGGYDGLRSVLSAKRHGSKSVPSDCLKEGLEGNVRVPGKKSEMLPDTAF